MKFIVSSKGLYQHLQQLSKVVTTNPVLPILENFLFVLDGNNLTVTATDLQVSLHSSFQVEGAESGKIAVPAKLILETLKVLPEQPITISTTENKLVIDAVTGVYKSSIEDAQEFPVMSVDENYNDIMVSSDLLLKGINNTSFMCSTDELRPAMTGMLLDINKDGITFVATDGSRLSKYVSKEVNSNKDYKAIIPKKALSILKPILANSSECKLSLGSNTVKVEQDGVVFECRVIDERYPNYEAVLPKEHSTEVNVMKDSLIRSLKRVSIYSNKQTHRVKLLFTSDNLTISSEDIDFGKEAVENIECSLDGDEMAIGLNSKFLIETLSIFDDEVIIYMTLPTKAAVIKPQHQEEGEDLLVLLMPIILND